MATVVVKVAVAAFEAAVPIEEVVVGSKMIPAKEVEAVADVEAGPAKHGKEEAVASGHSLHGWERVLEGKPEAERSGLFERQGENDPLGMND